MAYQTLNPVKRQALHDTLEALQETYADVQLLRVARGTDIVAHIEALADRLDVLNQKLKAIIATVAADG